MRKRSAETKLLYAKQDLADAVEMAISLDAELKQRRHIGAMLSNIAYNLAQRESTEPSLRATCAECRKAWDEIHHTTR